MDGLSIIHCDVCMAGAGRLSEALVIARIQTGAGQRDAGVREARGCYRGARLAQFVLPTLQIGGKLCW